ncbi:hypothetical protein FRC02_006541 [Tulasnella sp. 418]|nr:hypothetical protein FRC02_006541 [Tulasnella sp. 418]
MPLTSFEKATITAQLRTLEEKLDDITLEQMQLTQRLEVLHHLQKSTQSHYNRAINTLRSPILGLPNELLSLIFVMVVYSPIPAIAQARVALLSHTCHRFRETVLATPALWTHIDMREGPPYEKSTLYIERSGACPLHVNIGELESITSFERHFLANILAPELHRCEVFHLTSHMIEPFHILLPWFVTSPAPFLSRLDLYYLGEQTAGAGWQTLGGSNEGPPTTAFGGNANRLTSMTISGVHMPWTAWSLSGLKELAFDFHSPDVLRSFANLMDVLTSSPGLEKLSLMQAGSDLRLSPNWYSIDSKPVVPPDFIDARRQRRPRFHPVELPCLQELGFSFTESGLACDLIHLIRSPNITSLTLEYVKFDCGPLLELLSGDPPRFPSVTHLRLVGLMSIGPGKVVEFLRTAAAKVTHLHVNAVNCPTLKEIAFLSRWMVLERGELLFPKLRELTAEGLSPRNIREMVQSRPTSGRPEKIRMRRRDWVVREDENMSWLRENTDVDLVEGSSDNEEDG